MLSESRARMQDCGAQGSLRLRRMLQAFFQQLISSTQLMLAVESTECERQMDWARVELAPAPPQAPAAKRLTLDLEASHPMAFEAYESVYMT
jgi:hypothetical protein